MKRLFLGLGLVALAVATAACSGAQSGPLRPKLPRTKARAAAVSCLTFSVMMN